MTIKILGAGIAILWGGISVATSATPEEILRSAWKDPRLDLQKEAVALASDQSSLNPLEKTQLRLDLGQLNQEDIKLGVRFYPRGYSEYKTTKNFQESLERNARLGEKETLSKLLVSRYDLLARLIYVREKKQLSTELKRVQQRAQKALSLSARNDRSELKSYLKKKEDLEKLDLKVTEIESEEKNLQDELRSLQLGKMEDFDLQDIAPIDALRESLTKLERSESTTATLSAQVAATDLEKSRAAMAYERAKDDKWLDHIEVSLKDDRGEKVYGVSAAFNLPFAGAPDLSRIDDELKDLRDKVKNVETLKASEREFRNSLLELQTLLHFHQKLKGGQGRMTPDQLHRASQAITSQDPLLALELQRSWYEAQEQLLDVEYRIRTLYVLYLHESSTLATNPEKNYFSMSGQKVR